MLLLASKSPRRHELLKLLTLHFKIVVKEVDETIIKNIVSDRAKEISKMKAYEIHGYYPNDIILAVDTIVVIDDLVLGKPKTKDEAFAMLKRLSGRKHHVVSGFTLIGKDFEVNKSVATAVWFNKLSDQQINDYIASGSPFDKAGGYGIQDKEFNLIEKIEGSYHNVMGLPVEALRKYIK